MPRRVNKDKQYWMCIIGGVPKKTIPSGADFPLRMAVRDKFFDMFGDDEVCASGWGIDEKRYEVLRTLHLLSTGELEKLLKNRNRTSNSNVKFLKKS